VDYKPKKIHQSLKHWINY